MRFLLHDGRAGSYISKLVSFGELTPTRRADKNEQARELVASLMSYADGGQGDSWEPPCQSPPPKGSADPSGLPGVFVQRPPVKTPVDILALRSTGLYVLIYMGTIPDVSRTEITMIHIVRVPYVEF